MDILLINPPFTIYGGLKGHGGKAAPVNLSYLASYILKMRKNDNVKILDAEALRLTLDDIKHYIRENPTDVIGISVSTPAYSSALEVAKIAKGVNRNIRVVLGGIHVSAFPRQSCQVEDIDAVVVGEGEVSFSGLLNAYEDNSALDKVKGICFKDNADIVLTEPQPLIEDLDALPFPARHLLPNELYELAPTKRISLFKTTMLTSARGCPYNCSFCSAKVVWQRRYRARSPQNIIEEIEQCIKDFGIREFSMTDELFTMDKERVFSFCKGIIRKKLKIAWVCMSRAGYVTEDLLRAMKMAGCREISFGLESGDERILQLMHKQCKLDAARESIKLVKKVGIKTHASYLIGHIGETDESIRKTIDFAKELNTDIAAFFIASPLPGTELYDKALQSGYIREGVDWKDFSPLSKSKPVLSLPNLNSDDLMRWHRRILREYYLRPQYIIRRILRLGNPVEVANLFNGLLLFLRVNR